MAALDQYLVDAGIGGLVLETAEGSRSGADLRTLVDHARRFRTLMTYAPRRYDARLLEALALTGGPDPAITAEDPRPAAPEPPLARFGASVGRQSASDRKRVG